MVTEYAENAPQMLTPKDVGRKLGVGRMTVRALIRKGQLAGYRVGRQIRIDPQEVNRFLEAAKMGASSGKRQSE